MTLTTEDRRLIFGRDNSGRIFAKQTDGTWVGLVLARVNGAVEMGRENGLSVLPSILPKSVTPDSDVRVRQSSDGALYFRLRSGLEYPLVYQRADGLFYREERLGGVNYDGRQDVFGIDVVDTSDFVIALEPTGAAHLLGTSGEMYAVATELVAGVFSLGSRVVSTDDLFKLLVTVNDLTGIAFNFENDTYTLGKAEGFTFDFSLNAYLVG